MLKFKKIKGNLIHETAIINWKKLDIGKNNIIGPYVVIGNRAQHPNAKSVGKIYIGNNNFDQRFVNENTIFYNFCQTSNVYSCQKQKNII